MASSVVSVCAAILFFAGAIQVQSAAVQDPLLQQQCVNNTFQQIFHNFPSSCYVNPANYPQFAVGLYDGGIEYLALACYEELYIFQFNTNSQSYVQSQVLTKGTANIYGISSLTVNGTSYLVVVWESLIALAQLDSAAATFAYVTPGVGIGFPNDRLWDGWVYEGAAFTTFTAVDPNSNTGYYVLAQKLLLRFNETSSNLYKVGLSCVDCPWPQIGAPSTTFGISGAGMFATYAPSLSASDGTLILKWNASNETFYTYQTLDIYNSRQSTVAEYMGSYYLLVTSQSSGAALLVWNTSSLLFNFVTPQPSAFVGLGSQSAVFMTVPNNNLNSTDLYVLVGLTWGSINAYRYNSPTNFTSFSINIPSCCTQSSLIALEGPAAQYQVVYQGLSGIDGLTWNGLCPSPPSPPSPADDTSSSKTAWAMPVAISLVSVGGLLLIVGIVYVVRRKMHRVDYQQLGK